MRPASFLLSLALHAIFFLLAVYWPEEPPVRLDAAPVLISLVEGAPGGNRAPSPVLGPQGAPGNKLAPSLPAPVRQDVAPPVPVAAEPIPAPREEPKPEPRLEPELKPKEPEPAAAPLAEKKRPVPPSPPKEEKAPRPPEAAKPAPPKTAPPKEAPRAKSPAPADPVKAALEKARAASRESAPQRGNAVERALAEARRESGGFGGGGGGEGEGPGGGGLLNVFLGQIKMAVRPNWQFTSASRRSIACLVRVRLDADGNVLNAQVEQSSGNPVFDASAVNAVVRTGALRQFPAPPGPEYYDLAVNFNSSELMGR